MRNRRLATKQTNFQPALNRMIELLSLDPYLRDFENITDKIMGLGQKTRNELLFACENILSNEDLRNDEASRVAAAKVLIALVPDSSGSILKWINTKSGKGIYEVHFSLFCFLDQVHNLPNGKELAKEIPKIIEEYLMRIKTEAAFAAFMAGDLLGEHWIVRTAFPVLMRLSKKAKYVAGRDNALHGLAHMLRRLSDTSSKKASILSLIEDVSKNDRSSIVRLSADMILKGILI